MPTASPHSETFMPTTIRFAVIAGGAAGALTVTGIKTYDVLKSVLNLTDKADLTSEFSISAANTITNAGGTATTGDALLVVYDSVPANLGA